jgi:muramoyltetrapeptide carboxypeptidase LdcA involved in peptidoglycan recycling
LGPTQRQTETSLPVHVEEFGRPDLFLVTNMDFGHTEPQFVLPLGIKAEVDVENRTFRLLESALK